jgi:hypothetical protein
MMPGTWMTNNPEAAQKLREADAAYERERETAHGKPLAEKIAIYRTAKANLNVAYAAILKEVSA